MGGEVKENEKTFCLYHLFDLCRIFNMPKKLREKDKSASTALLEAIVMLLFTVVTFMFFL